jgi:hypothetical protein
VNLSHTIPLSISEDTPAFASVPEAVRVDDVDMQDANDYTEIIFYDHDDVKVMAKEAEEKVKKGEEQMEFADAQAMAADQREKEAEARVQQLSVEASQKEQDVTEKQIAAEKQQEMPN